MNHREIAALMAGIAPIINEHVERCLSRGLTEIQSRLDAVEKREPIKGEKGDSGDNGKDGKDADPEMISAMVSDAIAKIPAPENGKDGAPGKNGIDGKDADPSIIEQLVTKAIAKIEVNDGKDGQPGRDGRDGLPGKDGIDGTAGKDGKDGVGFDDMNIEYDGERKLSFVFSRDDVVKEFSIDMPVPIDRGVWKDGDYKKGDSVSWGGSLWIAQQDTATKPDTADSHWRLAVKRGRDGKTNGVGR